MNLFLSEVHLVIITNKKVTMGQLKIRSGGVVYAIWL